MERKDLMRIDGGVERGGGRQQGIGLDGSSPVNRSHDQMNFMFHGVATPGRVG